MKCIVRDKLPLTIGTQNCLLSDGHDVWLGIHRPSTSDILEDFVYYSDGSSITYGYWKPGDPDNKRNSEHCVSSLARMYYKWSDCYCSWIFGLICEV